MDTQARIIRKDFCLFGATVALIQEQILFENISGRQSDHLPVLVLFAGEHQHISICLHRKPYDEVFLSL